jgi:hypothetical protein
MRPSTRQFGEFISPACAMARPVATRRALRWIAGLIALSLLLGETAIAAPLDAASGVAAAYGLRQLRSAYSGPAIKVRRSSDNAQTTIGFDSSGNLDTATLTAFVGSGYGYVQTWYDQSGSAHDMVQATTGFQPLVVQAGTLVTRSGRPAVYVPLGAQMAVTPASWLVTGNGDRALNAVMTRNSLTVFAVWSGTHSGNRAFGIDLAGNALYAPYTYSAGDTTSAAITAGTTHVVSAVRTGGVSSGYLDGAFRASNSQAIITDANFGLGIGTRPDGVNVDGWYSEIVYFNTAIPDYGRKGLERDQGTYFGLTISVSNPAVSISVTNTSSTVANGTETANFKAIPGATIAYSVKLTNLQDSPDQNSIVIEHAIPATLDLFVGNLANGAPFTLTNGSPGCGLTISFVSLSSTTDDVEFLNASNALIIPVGDAAGFSSLVRKLRFRAKGQLNANWGTAPNCTLTYRARVR